MYCFKIKLFFLLFSLILPNLGVKYSSAPRPSPSEIFKRDYIRWTVWTATLERIIVKNSNDKENASLRSYSADESDNSGRSTNNNANQELNNGQNEEKPPEYWLKKLLNPLGAHEMEHLMMEKGLLWKIQNKLGLEQKMNTPIGKKIIKTKEHFIEHIRDSFIGDWRCEHNAELLTAHREELGRQEIKKNTERHCKQWELAAKSTFAYIDLLIATKGILPLRDNEDDDIYEWIQYYAVKPDLVLIKMRDSAAAGQSPNNRAYDEQIISLSLVDILEEIPKHFLLTQFDYATHLSLADLRNHELKQVDLVNEKAIIYAGKMRTLFIKLMKMVKIDQLRRKAKKDKALMKILQLRKWKSLPIFLYEEKRIVRNSIDFAEIKHELLLKIKNNLLDGHVVLGREIPEIQIPLKEVKKVEYKAWKKCNIVKEWEKMLTIKWIRNANSIKKLLIKKNRLERKVPTIYLMKPDKEGEVIGGEKFNLLKQSLAVKQLIKRMKPEIGKWTCSALIAIFGMPELRYELTLAQIIEHMQSSSKPPAEQPSQQHNFNDHGNSVITEIMPTAGRSDFPYQGLGRSLETIYERSEEERTLNHQQQDDEEPVDAENEFFTPTNSLSHESDEDSDTFSIPLHSPSP